MGGEQAIYSLSENFALAGCNRAPRLRKAHTSFGKTVIPEIRQEFDVGVPGRRLRGAGERLKEPSKGFEGGVKRYFYSERFFNWLAMAGIS